MRALPLLAVTAALCACATMPRAPAVDTGTPRTIAYETSACFGVCPVYKLTLDTATGAGTFRGERFTGVTGTRDFTATPQQSLAFSAAVDELRREPDGVYQPNGKRCATEATDLPSVIVTWSSGGTATATRRVYFGCGMDENRALFERLRHAPDALPVADFIARR